MKTAAVHLAPSVSVRHGFPPAPGRFLLANALRALALADLALAELSEALEAESLPGYADVGEDTLADVSAGRYNLQNCRDMLDGIARGSDGRTADLAGLAARAAARLAELPGAAAYLNVLRQRLAFADALDRAIDTALSTAADPNLCDALKCSRRALALLGGDLASALPPEVAAIAALALDEEPEADTPFIQGATQ